MKAKPTTPISTGPARLTSRWPASLRSDEPRSKEIADLKQVSAIQREFCKAMTGVMPKSDAELLSLLARKGISGLGYGMKITGGRGLKNGCLRVYVSKKKKSSALSKMRRIPKTFRGLATDVIELPHIDPEAIFAGASIGLGRVSGGTLGCVVKKGGRYYALSNNHVLANFNQAAVGDEITHPSAFSPGTPRAFARLTDYEPIAFGETEINDIDAAIAEIISPGQVSPQIYMIGKIADPPAPAYEGMPVKKYGAATELRSGVVEGCFEHFQMKCPDGRIAQFRGQVAVNGGSAPFSGAGDSGSLVVGANTNRPVGLLIGGNSLVGLSYMTPVQPILDRFEVVIAR